MNSLDVPHDSYGFWLLVSLLPAGLLAVTNYSVTTAVGTAVVVSTAAYFLFNYPF